MSADDLAIFLRRKMGEQRSNNTDMVKQINISRRTWYRLLSADIEEAKLSTLIKLANALDVSTTQLVHIYFKDSATGARPDHKKFMLHTNIPSNSLVKADQRFTKTWEIKNNSNGHWQDITLRCIDDTLLIQSIDKSDKMQPVPTLTPEHRQVSIPDIRAGEVATISVNFRAPKQLGAIISHWCFYKQDELLCESTFPRLDCLVKVVK